VHVSLDNTELLKILQQLGDRAGSVAMQIAPNVAEMLVAGVHDVYDAEGPGWKDLADSTKNARRGSSYKILQDSGVMAMSTAQAFGPDWAEAHGGAAYTIFHVTGTKFMPRRDPFDLGPFMQDVLEDTTNLLLQHVVQ
jgi:phage gpG-like protein